MTVLSNSDYCGSGVKRCVGSEDRELQVGANSFGRPNAKHERYSEHRPCLTKMKRPNVKPHPEEAEDLVGGCRREA